MDDPALLQAIQKARQMAAKFSQNGPVKRSAEEAAIAPVKVVHAYKKPATNSNPIFQTGSSSNNNNNSQGSHSSQSTTSNTSQTSSGHRDNSHASHGSQSGFASSGHSNHQGQPSSHHHNNHNNDNNNTNNNNSSNNPTTTASANASQQHTHISNNNNAPAASGSFDDRSEMPRRQYRIPDDHDRTEILIPHAVIGLVIGKKGENIKRIQNETGATVRVDPNTIDEQGNKMCTITGPGDSVKAALVQVKNVIENHKRGARDGPNRSNRANPNSNPHHQHNQQQQQHPLLPQQPTIPSLDQPQASADINAAWSAYLAQYYAQCQQPVAMAHPGLAAPAQVPVAASVAAAAAAAAAASHQQPQSTNQQQAESSSAAATAQGQGSADYSAQWIQYYRALGMHDQANEIEKMVKRSGNDATETTNST